MPRVSQSFTSLSGGVSRNPTSVPACDHEAIGISGAPDVTCRGHIKDFWLHTSREHGQKRSHGVACSAPQPGAGSAQFLPFQTLVQSCSQSLAVVGTNSILRQCVPVLHFLERENLFPKPDVNTSAAVQVQCLLPCILLFEPFLLWKRPPPSTFFTFSA